MRLPSAVWLAVLPAANGCGDDKKSTDTKSDAADGEVSGEVDVAPDVAPDTEEDTAPADTEDTAPADTEEDVADVADTTPEEGVEDTDDTADTTPPEPEWSCLGNVVGDPPTAQTVEFSIVLIDMLTRTPVEGVAIKVCAADDTACADPVSELTSDADGAVTVSVEVQPAGFLGFAELTKDGYVSVVALANVPITTGPATSLVRLAMVKTADLPVAGGALGTTIDLARGHLFVATWDCAELPASGAALSLAEADGDTVAFYLASGLPSPTATETDAGGGGGFVNVPVGDASVTMTVDGAFAGAGVAPIRAGWLTQIVMVPTPEPESEDWSCLGNVVGDPPVSDTIDLSLKVVDFVTRAPLEGVAIKVCNAADSCATPVAELVTDDNGEATPTIDVMPSGFVGYAELTRADLVPMLLDANVPVTDGPPTLPLMVPMVKATDVAILEGLLGTTLDPARGHLNVPTWDCAELPAGGVAISVAETDVDSTPFYVASGLPSATATETDAAGAGGVLNLPVGTVRVTTTVDGAFAGAGTTEIRAGWLTSFIMLPTPEPESEDWSCLGNVVGDPPPSETIDLSLKVIDFVTRAPLEGVAIKVCNSSDACATPVAELVTDENGEATPTITVMPSGFVGYAELTRDDCVSMLLDANVPVTDGPPTLPLMVPMVKTANLPILSGLLQTELDPERGHLNVPTWDCAELPAGGVALSVTEADEGSTLFYVAEGLPSATATETDSAGAGGVVNLRAGRIHVSTTVDGVYAGSGTTEIRAGWLTSFIMLPTPPPQELIDTNCDPLPNTQCLTTACFQTDADEQAVCCSAVQGNRVNRECGYEAGSCDVARCGGSGGTSGTGCVGPLGCLVCANEAWPDYGCFIDELGAFCAPAGTYPPDLADPCCNGGLSQEEPPAMICD